MTRRDRLSLLLLAVVAVLLAILMIAGPEEGQPSFGYYHAGRDYGTR
jgi:hypothetical protein